MPLQSEYRKRQVTIAARVSEKLKETLLDLSGGVTGLPSGKGAMSEYIVGLTLLDAQRRGVDIRQFDSEMPRWIWRQVDERERAKESAAVGEAEKAVQKIEGEVIDTSKFKEPTRGAASEPATVASRRGSKRTLGKPADKPG